MGDAIETGGDLRRHVEIGIGAGFTGAILDMRRQVARFAEHADERAAILRRPGHPVRREGMRCIALVAVDGRRREDASGGRVLEDAGDELAPEQRQIVRAIGRGGKQVDAGFQVADGLMQVPARREEIRQTRTGHECRVQAVAAANLLGRGAEQ